MECVPVAQPGPEQRFPKPKVAGSNPAGDTKIQGELPGPERVARMRDFFPISPRTWVYQLEYVYDLYHDAPIAVVEVPRPAPAFF